MDLVEVEKILKKANLSVINVSRLETIALRLDNKTTVQLFYKNGEFITMQLQGKSSRVEEIKKYFGGIDEIHY